MFIIPLHALDHFEWYNQLILESNIYSIQEIIIKNEENISIEDFNLIMNYITSMKFILHGGDEPYFR